MITVFGHRDADWDSVAAAVGAAHWLNLQGKKAQPAVAGPLPPDIRQGLADLGLPPPIELEAAPEKPFLVDHNAFAESFADMPEPVGIIDHHSFMNLSTQRIIFCRVEPMGSTSTIVAKLFVEHGLTPPPTIAKLLGYAIVSDTRAFKSTRTAPEDRQLFQRLAEWGQFELLEAVNRVLKPTPLEGLSIDQILQVGRKEYPLEAGTIAISYLDVLDDFDLLPQLLERMASLPYLLYALMIINVRRGTTDVYFTPEPRLKEAFPSLMGNRLHFDQIVARNHVLLPPLKGVYNKK